MMVTAYGDIPLITEVVPSLEDAKLPATPEADVVKFILDELNDITKDGALDVSPKQKGRITRGAALALKVRLCLFYKKYDEVIALSFNYGQRHSKELECAKKICKEHGVEHHILDMGLLNQLAPNSLTRVDMEVDHEAPEEGTPNSFVDGRNMLFLTFAAVFAKQRDIHVLVTGVSQSDFSGYPDCRHVFISSLGNNINTCHGL